MMEIACLGHDLDTCREEWRIIKDEHEDEERFKKHMHKNLPNFCASFSINTVLMKVRSAEYQI